MSNVLVYCVCVQQNEDLLKPTVVITAVAPPGIECGPECRRDLTCSIALLWASNAPALTTVKGTNSQVIA